MLAHDLKTSHSPMAIGSRYAMDVSAMDLNTATIARRSIEVQTSTMDSLSHKQDDPRSVSSAKSAPRTGGTDLEEANYMASDEAAPPSSLPPVDGGRQAWAYLLCATILETLVWGEHSVRVLLCYRPDAIPSGLPLSYGGVFPPLTPKSTSTDAPCAVFLDYYETVFEDATPILQQVGVVSTVGIQVSVNDTLTNYLECILGYHVSIQSSSGLLFLKAPSPSPAIDVVRHHTGHFRTNRSCFRHSAVGFDHLPGSHVCFRGQ